MNDKSSQSNAIATTQDLDVQFKELSSSPNGLSETEAAKRLEKYGANLYQIQKGLTF